MKNKLFASLTLALLSILDPELSTLYAQSTAFTYTGRLNNDGVPVNGAYDLRFTLFDASAGGNVIAGPLTVSPVDVANGLFTVRIDFGAGVFSGPPRWLNVEVRPAGGGAFTLLNPRQEATSSPYAIRAASAGTAADVSAGSVVKSLNTLKDAVTLVAGTNVTITPNGNTLTLAAAGAGGSGIWSVNGNNAYYNAGNVGIGTAVPSGKLSVATSDDTAPGIVFAFDARHAVVGTPAAGLSLSYSASTGAGYVSAMAPGVAWKDLVLQASTLRFNPSGATTSLSILNNGNVGIGTSNPQEELHMYNPAISVSHLIETGGGINAWAKVAFKNLNGQWDIGTSRGFNGDVFYMDRLGNSSLEFQLDPNGNLGLGVTPQAKLHMYNPANSVSHRIQTGGGVNAWTQVEFVNGNGQWNVGTSRGFNSDQFYIQRDGQAVGFAVQPNGDAYVARNATVCTLTIRGGCDLAEPFPMKEEDIAKGSVVVIDDEHTGQLKLSTEAYDPRVAGIISGANGVNAGIALHQEGAMDGGQNVALSGRVYVRADATFGAIKPGDLLTTSDTPGHAMKVTDHGKAQGAILGKAMSSLKQGTGMVLVLVTLQ